jgi:hypothetical protein
VFVAEVWVHPRYIKHWNYFRNDFPANVKTLVKNSDIALVLPANDMPFARWKRKQVLQFWRAAFTPLFVDGKHYTSGRMTMFFVAPPHVSAGFRRKLNLEHDEDFNNLVEWSPQEWRLRKKVNKATPKRRTRIDIEYSIPPGEVDDATEKLVRDVGPIITSHLGVDPSSREGKAIIAVLKDKQLSKTLLSKTRTKKVRLPAIKSWVKYNLWPRIRDFVAEEGINIGRSLANFAVQTTISIAVNNMLEGLVGRAMPNPEVAARYKQRYPTRYKIHRFRQGLGKVEYRPSQYASATGIGAGTLSYKFKTSTKDYEYLIDLLKSKALDAYKERTGDPIGPIGKEFINIRITPRDEVLATWNTSSIERFVDEVPEKVGYFASREDWITRSKVYLRMIGPELNNFYQDAKMAGVD